MRLSIEGKRSLVARYHAEGSTAEICTDAGIARSTFYIWIKPFDESRKRFGAKKITVVLGEQGIRTSPKYVAELMREMGLQSVTSYSKKPYQ